MTTETLPAITITLGIMSGKFSPLVLEGLTPTVSTALALAEMSPDGYEVRVNGQQAPLDMLLENGDKVFLLKKIQGN